jgi:hypothetical protein
LIEVKGRIVFPREVLLVEVERWCGDPLCGARTRLSLTKDEARAYTGFECARCERWDEDALRERDIPDWWEELAVTSLESLRPAGAGQERGEGAVEVVERMSEAWKDVGVRDTDAPPSEGEAGEPS